MNTQDTLLTTETESHRANLEAAFQAFQAAHPQIVEAMAVMNLSFADYLETLAALEERPLATVSNNVFE